MTPIKVPIILLSESRDPLGNKGALPGPYITFVFKAPCCDFLIHVLKKVGIWDPGDH